MRPRIAITGIGVVSPFGVGRERYWDHVTRGVSGTRTIDEFDASPFGCQVAASLPAIAIDDAAFTTYADPATAMQDTSVIGASFNWYPVRGIALVMSYGHMIFRAFGESRRTTTVPRMWYQGSGAR